MAQKISAKYLGTGGAYLPGIPARDLSEAEFAALPDEAKARLAETPPEGVKPLYQLRHEAPDEAQAAAVRVADAGDVTTVGDTAPAPAPAADGAADAPTGRRGGKGA